MMGNLKNGQALVVIALIVASFFVNSFAAVPPLGDVKCQAESCNSTDCAIVPCAFGKLMTDPDSSCGCCKLCLDYIDENETCVINANDRECGPGLHCKNIENSKYVCIKMNTSCFQAQEDYDARKLSGLLGMYETRPNCDANGEFAARKCQPGSSCHCIDKNNKRIFGESSPNIAARDITTMNCECSRAYQSTLDEGSLGTQQFSHCLPNGNYDLLQCVEQACFCIDSIDQSVKSTVQPITAIRELPCYKPDVHTADYYRPCEIEKKKIRALTNSYFRENITVLGLEEPKCSPDGFYQTLLETTSTLFCADPFGLKIEYFEVDKESLDASSMNCRCARTRYWLSKQNMAKPICCKNGNYRPIQCRGGVCFCVDSDGNQNGVEVQKINLNELHCYNKDQYPNC